MTISTLFNSMLTHLSSKIFIIFRFKVEYGCSLLFCDEKDCLGSE